MDRSHRRKHRRTLRPYLPFVVVLFVLMGGPQSRADYDGRLPVDRGRMVYRFGDSAPPEVERFWARYDRQWVVYWDHLLGTPRYLSPRAQFRIVPDPRTASTYVSLAEGARRFVDENRDFFGFASDDLIGPETAQLDGSTLLIFRQAAGGIPIRGACLRFMVAPDGTIRWIKNFSLRGARASAGNFVPFEVIERYLTDLGVRIDDAERQYYFLRYDPSGMTPVWWVRGAEAGGEPREYFFDPETGGLREERRLVYGIGEVRGTVKGIYPNPQDVHAKADRFTDPTGIGFPVAFPIEGARIVEPIQPSSDAFVASDERGDFVFTFPGPDDSTVDLTSRIEFALPCEQIPPLDGDGNQLCEGGENLKILLDVLRPPDDCSPHPFVGSLEDYRMRHFVAGAGRDTLVEFLFNRDRGIAFSMNLMTFHHMREFMEETLRRIQENGLSFLKNLPLRVVVLNTLAKDDFNNRRLEYLPDRELPKICISTIVGRQWVTPTMLNHEFAHHAFFVLTGALQGERLDCNNAQWPVQCIEFMDPKADDEERALELIKQREANAIEAIADALAAYQGDTPQFGFYEANAFPGPMAYDISVINGKLEPDRAELAESLWFFREFLRNLNGKDESNVAVNVLYRWIAANRTMSPTDRLFDGSETMVGEFLDILDTPGVTLESDRNSNTISIFDKKLIEAFSGRTFFYPPFIRGDADLSGILDLTDPIYILRHLFLGERDERCQESMDCDDDDQVVVSDPIFLLNHLFLAGPTPPLPYPNCGVEPISNPPRFDTLRCTRMSCPF